MAQGQAIHSGEILQVSALVPSRVGSKRPTRKFMRQFEELLREAFKTRDVDVGFYDWADLPVTKTFGMGFDFTARQEDSAVNVRVAMSRRQWWEG